MGLGKYSNASKGAKDWTDWEGHSKYGAIPEPVRQEMLRREQKALAALKNAINERLRLIK